MPENLYAAFQDEVGNDYNITKVMGDWVKQPGYPIIDVRVANDRKRIDILQKRFLQRNLNHQDKTVWNVPLTYASNRENRNFSSTKPIALLSNISMEIDLREPVDWIIFNVQQTGTERMHLKSSPFR